MHRSTHKGVALVIVLCLLVLISGIVVAFFSSVSTEYLTAKNASAGVSSKELADATVQVVMGQIRQATSSGTGICWASQPGMIRTWGESDGSASFRKLAFYKLYSSDTMVVTGSGVAAGYKPDDDVPNADDWARKPALYTDLNAPVVGVSGTTFPIVDPRAAEVISGTGNYSMVEGFSINTNAANGTTAPIASGSSVNHAPMPVRWIYVLRDGSMILPDAASSGTATVTFTSGTKSPTWNNPIVGRVAFWTDDETCKLNINTAAGGSPWDQPMFDSGIESAFSRYQPAANEYSRYPGHPAGTSLSPVFWSFSSMPSPDYSIASNPTYPTSGMSARGDWAPTLTAYAKDYWQKVMRISPRNEFGDSSSVGTAGGSQMATVATAGDGVVGAGGATGSGYACPVDSDRLYASVDELMFTRDRDGRANVLPYELQLEKKDLQKIRFFLTANSRAPEVSLYNKPKVAIWPVPDLNNKSVANIYSVTGDTRSPSDKLIAFCSTLNKNSYYFTRYDSTSGTNDFLLNTGTSQRNIILYEYLKSQLSSPIPGFGGTFSSRYGAGGTAQILTEIYDYIRSCINLTDSSAGSDNDLLTTRMKWSYAKSPGVTGTNKKTGSFGYGCGQVIPFTHPDNGTHGLGRFPTIKQATIQFIARGANQPPVQVVTDGSCAGRPLIFNSGTVSLLNSDNMLTTAGAVAVFTGTAFALPNEMHPFSADPVVSQLTVKEKDGTIVPVLAVNSEKLKDHPNDLTAIYPIFTVSNAYPTIAYYNGKDMPIQIVATGEAQSFTVLSEDGITPQGTYKYYKGILAGSDGNPIPGTPTCSAQTHAGLRYLTVPRVSGGTKAENMEGAYDLENPRYQISKNESEGVGQAKLTPYQTQIEAIFYVDPVNNAPGWTPLFTDYQVRIVGLDGFAVDGDSMQFPSDATEMAVYMRDVGGGISYDMGALSFTSLRRNTSISSNASIDIKASVLSFYSKPNVVGTNSLGSQGSTFQFTGNNSLVIYLLTSATTSGKTVQTYNIQFPSGTFPTPKLPFIPSFACGKDGTEESTNYPYTLRTTGTNKDTVTYPPTTIADLTPSSVLTFTQVVWTSTNTTIPNLLSSNPNFGVFNNGMSDANGISQYYTTATEKILSRTRLYCGYSRGAGMELVLPERDVQPTATSTDYKYKLTADTVRSVECLYGDTRVIAALSTVPAEFFAKHKYYDDTTMRSAHSIYAAGKFGMNENASVGTLSALRGATVSYLSDVTVNLNDPKTSYAARDGQSGGWWGYPKSAPDKFRELLGINTQAWSSIPTNAFPRVTSSVDFNNPVFASIWETTGDFDNGPNFNPDGPYINKASETNGRADANKQAVVPDFNSSGVGTAGDSLFSPNRQIASAVMFGSLPAGFSSSFDPKNPTLSAVTPWRSLLFCPNPNSPNHPSLGQIVQSGSIATTNQAPDFAVLDLFQMPIVDPYAISEPFSTAGKVNMNYQIAPFTYIKRDTALRGVLRSVMVSAADDQFISRYKGNDKGTTMSFGDNGALDRERVRRGYWDFRYPVHPGATLQQFESRFNAGDLFHSAAEICSLWLYPATQPISTSLENPKDVVSDVGYSSNASTTANITALKNWWYDNKGTTRKSLTGDNMRERPYDTLYPRLTTKSNSYTVHFRVQVLKQDTNGNITQWTENPSRIVSEYRGSTLIERYIDPNDSNLPDFATTTNDTLDNYYKFRVVTTKKFTAE